MDTNALSSTSDATSASSLAAGAVLLRFVLLPTGEAIASFTDTSALLLNEVAGSYAVLSAEGTQMARGLCACAPSAVRPRLAAALHARNVLSNAPPRLFWPLLANLMPAPFRHFDLAATLDALPWEASPSPQHSFCHADGAIRVLSLDRRAWLLLHPDGMRFAVCFPVCVGRVADLPLTTLEAAAAATVASTESKSSKSAPAVSLVLPLRPSPADLQRYVFYVQLHSAEADAPPEWLHPLCLARTAAAGRLSTSTCTPVDQTEDQPSDGWVSEAELLLLLPRAGSAVACEPLARTVSDRRARAPQSVPGTTAPLPKALQRLILAREGAQAFDEPAAPAMSGIVRTFLPAAGPATSDEGEWRLRMSLSAAQALVLVRPLSADVPAEGARLLLTQHALFRIRPSPAPPLLTAHLSPLPPVTLTILGDGRLLRLAENERFWSCRRSYAPGRGADAFDATSTDDEATGCGTGEAVYAVGAVPPRQRCGMVGTIGPPARLCDLTAIGEALARKAREWPAYRSCGDDAARRAPGAPSAPASAARSADPAALLEEVEHEGAGRFRLFGDGRVSALFADGVVLTMRPAGPTAPSPSTETPDMLCELLYPDGRACTVRSSRPVGAESYVSLARQFHRWAAAAPEQRVADAQQRALEGERVRGELQRITRYLQVSPPLVATAGWQGGATASAAVESAVARTVALAAENELGKLARTLGDVDGLATPTTPTTPTTSRRKLRSPSSSPAAPLVLDALDELKRIQSFLLRANCEPQ